MKKFNANGGLIINWTEVRKMRKRGMTWDEMGKAVGFFSRRPGPALMQRAQKEGVYESIRSIPQSSARPAKS